MRYGRCKPVAEVRKTALESQLEPVAPIFRMVFLEKVVLEGSRYRSKREYATQRDGLLFLVQLGRLAGYAGRASFLRVAGFSASFPEVLVSRRRRRPPSSCV